MNLLLLFIYPMADEWGIMRSWEILAWDWRIGLTCDKHKQQETGR